MRWTASRRPPAPKAIRPPELYSPWRARGELAADWLKAQGSPERLRAFINTTLSELWDNAGQAGVTEADLMARRENYGPTLPETAAVVSAGADVQDDRVEVSVFAWGRGEELSLMAHLGIPGRSEHAATVGRACSDHAHLRREQRLEVTFHKVSFAVADIADTDRRVTVSVECAPQFDATNGVISAVAKCGVDGICQ